MSLMSASERSMLEKRIRENMRKMFLSNMFIEDCLASTPGILRFLDEECRKEVARREENKLAARIHNAGFPCVKNLDGFDFSELSMPQSMAREEMTDLSFIGRKHTLIMHGICGSGKTFLSIALGMKACDCGYKVRFYTLAMLALKLRTASEEGRLENMMKQLRNLDLLIIDEWGYCQLDKESAGYVFQVIADSYEHKSLILTTNLPFSEWGKIFADEQLAAAIIDRVVHYGHLIETGNKDWRIANSPMNVKGGVKKS